MKALKNHSLWFSKVLKTTVIYHLLKIKIKSFHGLFVLKTKMTPNNPLTNHVCFRQLEIRNKDGKSKPRAAKIRRDWGFFFLQNFLPFFVAMQVYLSLFFFIEPDRSLLYMAILPNLIQFNLPKGQTLMTKTMLLQNDNRRVQFPELQQHKRKLFRFEDFGCCEFELRLEKVSS